jgi:hypothetical protein
MDKMEDAFMADTVIAKGLCIFQLLPAIDETQWIVGPIIAAAVLVIDTLANASNITNLRLDVVDSTVGLRVKYHGLSGKRLYENLHDCVRWNDSRRRKNPKQAQA